MSALPKTTPAIAGTPFDLNADDAYRRWRDEKLENHPRSAEDLLVEVGNIADLTPAEHEALLDRCRRANMALYRCGTPCDDPVAVRDRLRALARQFGMDDLENHRSAAEDGLVALEVVDQGGRHGFIPYTNRAINWHTDGYYNPPEAPIRAMVLHCVRPAASGGINGVLDTEIAYIRLRDKDPELVAALMHPEAMTIPAHVEDNGRERATAAGPVFAFDPVTGTLLTRYTARKRNVVWRDDAATAAAVAALHELFDGDEPFLFHHRLAAGEGLLCNNVLHDRSGFEDDSDPKKTRLYFRARYINRIAGSLPASLSVPA
ncbi:MAG: taurine catabolism dioxygenase TauD [Hyphomicrobiales bacterium]|nr:MAG: taurine catabolism dioxygenase TauD [Hyphomicrobiales bacterium]